MKDKVKIKLVLVLLFSIWQSAAIAQHKVSGTVKDASDSSPLPGVNILVKGTNVGTSTDADGRYEISTPSEQDTLLFSFIGYLKKEIPIKGRNKINVMLKVDVQQLDEVIAVGYSEKGRTQVSSSVKEIDSETLHEGTTSNDLNSMLAGKMAGVNVMSGQREEGNESEIRIRGTGSLTAGSAPLVVVDGVIGGTYDPANVKSVTVLKDAGATGIYGSRAAGGVLIVKTKEGSRNQEPTVEMNLKTGVTKPNWGNLELMEGPALYDRIHQGYLNAGKTDAEFYTDFPKEIRNVNFDWQDWYYDPAMLNSYNVAISGGSENTSYYASGNYYGSSGMLKGDKFHRASLALKYNYDITNKISVNLDLKGQYSENLSDNFYPILMMPFDKPYDENGNVITGNEAINYYTMENINSALAIEKGAYNNFYQKNLNPTIKVDYNPIDWLSFSSTTRLLYSENFQDNFMPADAQLTSRNGEKIETNSNNLDILNNEILRASGNFKNHHLSGLLGVEFNKITYRFTTSHGANLPPNTSILSAASTFLGVSGNKTVTTFNSYFSQVNYDYKQKYFLTGSYRIDGSSRFGAENRYGNFYSVAASWMLTEEKFLSDINSLDQLKFRVSYGITGNADFADYRHLRSFQQTNSYNGGNVLVASTIGNPNLTWEKSEDYNIGIDAGLFQRLNFTLDYYYKKNEDLLFEVPLPSDVGYTEQWQNIARVDNWGIELSADARILQGEFNWSSNFQIAYNKSEIKSINDDVVVGSEAEDRAGSRRILTEGGPRINLYAKEWYGADPETGGPLWVKGYDNAGNPITTSNYAEARFITANGVPDFMGGFTNTFRYKRFSLSTSMTFGFGNYTVWYTPPYNGDGAFQFRPQMILKTHNSRWEKPGDQAYNPAWVYQNSTGSEEASSRYWENGNYLKINHIGLGYNLPNRLLQSIGVQAAKVYIRGENLKTFAIHSKVSSELSGFDGDPPTYFFRPYATNYVFGINIKF